MDDIDYHEQEGGLGYIGHRLTRPGDPQIVRGSGAYVADIETEGLLEAAFARSWSAHGSLAEVDVDLARGFDGVVGAWAAGDLDFPDTPPTVPNQCPDEMRRPTLAKVKVRYCGEPLAVVVAGDRYSAEDGVALVDADIDPLPVVTNPTEAARDEVLLFEPLSNVVAEGTVGQPVEDLIAGAPVVLEASFGHPRVAHAAMEPRAILVVPHGNRLEVFCSHQAPHRLKAALGQALDLPAEEIRVRIPLVGGAFGGKSQLYPEYVAVARVALELGRPVRWIEDRAENIVASSHGRGQEQRFRLAADRSGKILAAHVEIDGDIGAWPHTGAFIPSITAAVMSGPYGIPNLYVRYRAVLTNAVPTTPYRGAGRPEATLAIEVMVDKLADALGLPPEEVRRRNFLSADRFPYLTATGEEYDSGDYGPALAMAVDRIKPPPDAAQDGSVRGLGFASFVERAGGQNDSTEFGRVDVLADGTITVRSGSMSTGQGHEVTFAQVVATVLDVGVDAVKVIQGDTDEVEAGIGTFGSRSVQLGGAALHVASGEVLTEARQRAAGYLEVSPGDLHYEGGVFSIAGAPSRCVTLRELAVERPLTASSMFAAKLTYPFGSYGAVVDLDTDTGEVAVRDVVAIDDCGTMVNPLLVEGQTFGSIAQGLGTALLEGMAFDGEGQPLVSSLMDYLLPTMSDIPPVHPDVTVTPSPTNPLGAKGAGEAGCIGTPAVISTSVLAALRTLGKDPDRIELPFTPERVWRLARDGEVRS